MSLRTQPASGTGGLTQYQADGGDGGPPARRGAKEAEAMTAPAGRSPHRVRPRADCTADSAGGLTFDIAHGAASGPGAAADAGRWDAALLLRRRPAAGERAAEEVRLPLVPAGPGALRAVLPSTMRLTEGVWDAHLSTGGGTCGRLLPGTDDLRSLVDRVPRADRTWLGVRIPYTTGRGHLALRSWHRWPHAEAGDLRLAKGVLTLHGRLYGAALARGARLEARTPGGGEPVAAGPAREDGDGFAARLPLAGAARDAAGDAQWEVWLRPGAAAAPVRVARILDDVKDKRRSLRYPAVPLAGGARLVRACYTSANELAVRLEAGPPRG
ncbi:hypothetical protein V1J52_13975 [Streptomyces sp. TRM 70351]|uniref:hypothetical protein n=1 Tax=Streptomyces sp. TRM 70351 TaxID=3116552 RepID=UPI002E7B0F22|nr:hypothetical protein [Streptomyces sp. TRM 70351]MEE1929273.1 hypothetical protein [Streptomyces sp. TRM 70351]